MGNKKRKSKHRTASSSEAQRRREEAKAREKRNNIIIIALTAFLSVAIIVGITLALGFNVFNWGGRQNFKATHHATIEIENYGTVKLELYGKEAPITVENFVYLANSGFYNGLTFHRIIEGFMAQGGKGSVPIASIKGEFKDNGVDNDILHRRGVISMARSDDPDSATSQFFIMHQTTEELDGAYAAFGKVISGMEIIDAICEDAVPYDNNGSILPAKQPIIKSISIHEAH